MRSVIIIGTVHIMLPEYEKEFKSLLEEIDPDQLLVEIWQKDFDDGNLSDYPAEMVYAARWALAKDKDVKCFDCDIDIMLPLNQEEETAVEQMVKDIMDKHGWSIFNRTDYPDKERVYSLFESLIDKRNDTKRQRIMLENVKKLMAKEGKVLILTGAFHLDFFQKNLPEAKFPLRQ